MGPKRALQRPNPDASRASTMMKDGHRERTGVAHPLIMVLMTPLLLLAMLPAPVTGQVATCLDRLHAHTTVKNVLQAADYADLVQDLSGVRLDMGSRTRTAIHQAFDVHVDPALNGMDLTQTSFSSAWSLPRFCETIYEALFPFFIASKVPRSTCHAAVAVATSLDGKIDANGDFVALVRTLSPSTASIMSFDELRPGTQQVFADFGNAEGVIPETLFLSDEAMEGFLCHRVMLSTLLDHPPFDPRIPGTLMQQPKSLLATPAPSLQWSVDNDLQQEQEDITEAEYQDCRIGLLVVDTERDDRLNRAEFVGFVNRYTGNAFSGTAFADLPSIFRNLYTSGTDDEGTIPTDGARPGSDADEGQLLFLRNFCIDTYFAVSQWRAPDTNVPTNSPSLPPLPDDATARPTRSPVTSEPTLSDGEYALCTVNLHLSDINGDGNNRLSEAEYVGYLNRQLNDVYKTTSYSKIDEVFRENFENLAGNGGAIDISGSLPGGSPTASERQALRRICQKTDRAITIFEESTRTPTRAPVAESTQTPTSIPTLGPTRITELQECFLLLEDADADQNNFLNEDEYAAFVADVGQDIFTGTFGQLDAVLQEPYNAYVGPIGVIFLIGIRPEDDPSPEQARLLEVFCAAVYNAVDTFLNPPQPTEAPRPTPAPEPTSAPEPTVPPLTESPTRVTDDPDLRNCLIRLDQIDDNANGILDESEYIAFANDLAEEIANNPNAFQSPLARQPYILRDNYVWIAEGADDVDISGADRVGLLNDGELARFRRLCSRTNSTVTSVLTGNDETGLAAHCYASFTAGDTDENNLLSESELRLTVDYFLGRLDNSGGFDGLDEAFRDYFEANEGSFDGINVDGSKPTENPTTGQQLLLDYLCVELESAADKAREAYSLVTRCQDAMRRANANQDDTLTGDEYANFVYFLAGRDSSGETFNELPGELQANYNALRGTRSVLDVTGWNGEAVSSEQREEFDFICSSTSDLLAVLPTLAPTLSPTEAPRTITIYNGFIVGNKEGIAASGLRNADISDLEAAYTAFVNTTASQMGIRRLRGRRLEVQGISLESTEIYRISDGDCPDTFQDDEDDARCQDAYASFDLLVSDEEGNDEIEEQYTTATRQGIVEGDLQAQLDAKNSESRLEIIGATASNRPGGDTPTNTSAPTAAPNDSSSREGDGDGGSDILIIILIVVGVLVCCCVGGCCVYFGMKKNPAPESKTTLVEQPQTGHIGELPKEGASSEGEYSIYDEIVPEPGVRDNTLLPHSDHSNEVNFGFGGQSVQEHTSSYSGYGKTSLETVPDDDEDETESERFEDETQGQYDDSGEYEEEELAESQTKGWAGASNPWGGAPVPASSHSDSDSEGSEELVEKVSPYRGGREPLSMSRSNISSSGLSRTGSGLSRTGSGLSRTGSMLNRSATSLDRTASLNSGMSQPQSPREPPIPEQPIQEAAYNESGELSYMEEEVLDDSEESYEEEEVFEEEPQPDQNSYGSNSQSQFEDDPQFEESYSEASFLSGTSEERQTQLAFREEIEALVKKVVPDEIENIDAMIDQFVGREQELIATLRNMADQGAHITESSDDEEEEEDDEEDDEEQIEEEEESYGEEDVTSYEDGESQYGDEEDGESEYEESEYEEEDGESEYDEAGESEYDEEEEDISASQYEEEEDISASQYEEEEEEDISASQYEEEEEDSYEEEEMEEVKPTRAGATSKKGLFDDSSSDSSSE